MTRYFPAFPSICFHCRNTERTDTRGTLCLVDNHTSIGTNINFFFLSIISSIVNIFFLYININFRIVRIFFNSGIELTFQLISFRVINIRTDVHLTSILGRKSNRPSLRVSFERRCILSLVDVSLNKYGNF